MAYAEIEIPFPTIPVEIVEEGNAERIAVEDMPFVPAKGDLVRPKNDGRLYTVQYTRYDAGLIQVIVK